MQAHLRNSQGCTFDSTEVDTFEDAVEWAKGRGGTYTLMIEADNLRWDYYTVSDDEVSYGGLGY